jgi:hypothetical protein
MLHALFNMSLQFNVSRCFSFMFFTAVYVGSAWLSHWIVVGVLIIMPWVLGFFYANLCLTFSDLVVLNLHCGSVL